MHTGLKAKDTPDTLGGYCLESSDFLTLKYLRCAKILNLALSTSTEFYRLWGSSHLTTEYGTYGTARRGSGLELKYLPWKARSSDHLTHRSRQLWSELCHLVCGIPRHLSSPLQ